MLYQNLQLKVLDGFLPNGGFMARIANEVIERIKVEVSLVRLVESQGYKLQKHGKDVAVRCPFHEDKTPSCVITPKSNLFNCFGCGAVAFKILMLRLIIQIV